MGLSFWHLVVVLLVVLVVFGAGRLPQVMGDLGKGIRNFKSGMNNEPADDKKDPAQLTGGDKSDSKVS
jgi:sec-independent protein translocase protein TatA